jgi:hypothetical protein
MFKLWKGEFRLVKHQFRINLDRKLFDTLEATAHTQKVSINQLIVGVLAKEFGEGKDQIILGWVKLDRWGELDHHPEDPMPCTECGQDILTSDAYVGLVKNGGFHGPVCGGCATSE